MTRSQLIRTIDAVETPAAGHWEVGAAPAITVAWTRRDAVAATVERGSLFVADRHGDVRLSLAMNAPASTTGAPVPIELRATVRGALPTGTWPLAGAVSIDGEEVAVSFDATYHGVFRRQGRAWAWVSLKATVPQTGRRRRRGVSITADLTFDAPEPVETNHAELARPAA